MTARLLVWIFAALAVVGIAVENSPAAMTMAILANVWGAAAYIKGN